MKIIKEDLVLTKDTVFDESITVEGNIRGYYNLTVAGDINARDIAAWDIAARDITARDINARNITARNINARDINARNITARNITARNINARDINARNINAWDVLFYAICIVYESFKCISAKACRANFVLKCLDKGIEYINKTKHCDKCGAVLKDK